MRWIALKGVDHGAYYLLKDKVITVTLMPEAKVLTGTLTVPNTKNPKGPALSQRTQKGRGTRKVGNRRLRGNLTAEFEEREQIGVDLVLVG